MIYKTLDEVDPKTTLLLKGAPGTGKTYLCGQLPDAVVINMDNNLSGLRQLPEGTRNKLRIVNPRFSEDEKQLPGPKVFDNMIKQLTKVCEDDSVKTIILDSVTTMAELLMDKIIGSSNPSVAAKIQHYGEFTRYMKWFGDDLLCAQDLDKNIVFIAHEQLIMDSTTQETKYALNMVTKMKDSFELYFTDCWRTYTKVPTAGEVQYRIRTAPGNKFTAKCSSDLPNDFESSKEMTKIIKLFS